MLRAYIIEVWIQDAKSLFDKDVRLCFGCLYEKQACDIDLNENQ